MMKKLLGSLALLATLGLAACDQAEDESGAAAAMPPPAVGVVPATRQEVTPSLDFVGRIEAVDVVDLEARVTGFLVEKAVADGAMVEAGQRLFEIEPEPFEVAVAASRARLAGAEADLLNARLHRERMEELVAREAQPQARLDDAEALEAEAQAGVDAAEAALRQAEIDLGYTSIEAPFAGRLGRITVSEGAVVGPDRGPLARLVKLDPVYATIPVTDRAMLAVRRSQDTPGQFLPFLQLADGSLLEEPGQFAFFEPQVSETTSTIDVRATFANPEGLLLPGQFVTVKVRSAEPEMALTVPQTAVQQDQVGFFVLTVDAENRVGETRVEMGERLDTNWIVTGGLEEGESVIVDGLQKVRPGAVVAPSPAASAAIIEG